MHKTIGAATVLLGLAAATPAQAIASSTADNLSASMHDEAFAAAKYTLYGEQATQDNGANAATLFSSTAAVEQGQHFVEEAGLAGLVGTSVENLQNAIDGENYETTTMYPRFANQAERSGDTTVADQFREVAKDEAGHLAQYEAALNG